ncbi:MAG: siderophore-interacting protein [Pseudomonadota bacterium]
MTQANYPFEATADLPGVSFAAMRQMILMQAKSAGLTVLVDDAQHLTVETAHGLIGLRSGSASETAGFVGAVDEHWLFIMKSAVVSQMEHVMPELATKMRWSNGPEEGALPPNFAFAEVRDVSALGPNFYRVMFKGEDYSKHGDAAIHFRLVLPAEGAAPRWPSVAANGSVVWPDGPDAPHRPVYTTRSIDHDINILIMDVFIHEGGRVTDWARGHLERPAARRVVGLLGPSGGGLLVADRVLMATDETGFPAAARLLENLPEGATGDLLLEAENGAACAYPIAAPPGIEVTWLPRASGQSLRDATLALLPSHTGSKIWFAGEREAARSVREAAKVAGREADDLRISGFWRATDA